MKFQSFTVCCHACIIYVTCRGPIEDLWRSHLLLTCFDSVVTALVRYWLINSLLLRDSNEERVTWQTLIKPKQHTGSTKTHIPRGVHELPKRWTSSDNSVCSALSNVQSYYITDIKTLKNPQSTLENDIINSSGCQIKSKSDVNQWRPIPASLLL